ncbi:MAG: UvrD-helicase domain-containing protein [Nitrospiraceae bacterium]|nr:UvrD-helicase domain-containing protein [Nitrospiraceae bacterium]
MTTCCSKPSSYSGGHPDVLEELRYKYQYILIDEYQDTNALQLDITRLLVGPHKNICVVGDDDQSILRLARGPDRKHPPL